MEDNPAEMLEQIIDKHGLANVLGHISDICNEKAIHVATNWQDTSLAKAWDRCAVQVERCANKIHLEGIL